MRMALARPPRGLGLLPDEFWDLTPAEFWTMHDEHVEALRQERSDRAIGVLAIGQCIGGKDVTPAKIWKLITGEEPPWKGEADESMLDQIAMESRERAKREKGLK